MTDAATLQREMFSAIERRDLDGLRVLLHHDYAYTGTDGVEQAGADAAVAVAVTYTTAFPDLSFEFRAVHTPSDDIAIAEIVARGTHEGPLDEIPSTGRTARMVGCNVVEARDGRIVRERDYFDTLALMRQLGLAGAEAAGAAAR